MERLNHVSLYNCFIWCTLITSTLTLSLPGVPYFNNNVCAGYICLHRGTCVNTTGQPVCACVQGFKGDRCQTVVSAPAKNGSCPVIARDSTGLCPGRPCALDVVCPGTQKCCQTACSTKICSPPQSEIPPQAAPVAPTPDKNGTCPTLAANVPGQCPGRLCANDAGCSGTQKCCVTACSTTVCAQPAPVTIAVAKPKPITASSAGNTKSCNRVVCSAGSTCLLVRSSASTAGEAKCVLDADRTCWESGFRQAQLVPSAVKPGSFDTKTCGRTSTSGQACPQGSLCSLGGIESSRVCCTGQLASPQLIQAISVAASAQLVRKRQLDVCGGCPQDERCVVVPVRCGRTFCPTVNVCVKRNQTAKCPVACPAKYACVMRRPVCVRFKTRGSTNVIARQANSARACDPTRVPECLLFYASRTSVNPACPTKYGTVSYFMCSLYARSTSTCSSDSQCAEAAGAKGSRPALYCCPTACGTSYCMRGITAQRG